MASVHESSSIAMLDGDDIVYVVTVPPKRIVTVAISVPTRFPNRLRRLLGEVETRGWAVVDQELEDGLRSAAAPLTDLTGTTAVAISADLRSVQAA